ncbi:MAG: L-2-hydroxyglutarate oxidase, partial [Actinomycetota bacterium]
NSGVIHSGIYYRPGSHKARNCTDGYRQLIDFCDRHGIPYEICGKVIVATRSEELPRLEELYRRGTANGLSGLRELNTEELKEIEPHADGIRGIHVPQTGIIDFREVAVKYAGLLREKGVDIRLNSKLTDVRKKSGRLDIITENAGFETKLLLSCTGLQADRIARMTSTDLPLRIVPFRGEYYLLKEEKKYLVNSLIYPVPDPQFPFLGVHFTRMIDGAVEAGPNAVLALGREGYRKIDINLKDTYETLSWEGFRKMTRQYWRYGLGEVHRSLSKRAFAAALSRLLPEIRPADLKPAASGIRAQALSRDGKLLDDFYFHETENAIHVCNAPSPAATSSLAIADTVSGKALKALG